jgi:hypothetical protein
MAQSIIRDSGFEEHDLLQSAEPTHALHGIIVARWSY